MQQQLQNMKMGGVGSMAMGQGQGGQPGQQQGQQGMPPFGMSGQGGGY